MQSLQTAWARASDSSVTVPELGSTSEAATALASVLTLDVEMPRRERSSFGFHRNSSGLGVFPGPERTTPRAAAKAS